MRPTPRRSTSGGVGSGKRAFRIRARSIGAAALSLLTLAACETDLPSLAQIAGTGPRPDALWQIVSTCFPSADAPPVTARLCTCPALARSCCGDVETPDAAVVWAETQDFVAIRDMKACGCGPEFVAGLALPRARIVGIEDPARPEGIWPFAWGVARSRIAETLEIGLVINPADARTQNQMHVHMLRLKPGVREAIDRALESGQMTAPAPAIAIRLPDIDQVFASAARRLGSERLGSHGILVAAARDGGFAVLLTDRRSPQAFTRNVCR